jgi:hypothetical protein
MTLRFIRNISYSSLGPPLPNCLQCGGILFPRLFALLSCLFFALASVWNHLSSPSFVTREVFSGSVLGVFSLVLSLYLSRVSRPLPHPFPHPRHDFVCVSVESFPWISPLFLLLPLLFACVAIISPPLFSLPLPLSLSLSLSLSPLSLSLSINQYISLAQAPLHSPVPRSVAAICERSIHEHSSPARPSLTETSWC